MIWIYTVCKDRVYPGSAGLGIGISSKAFSHIMHEKLRSIVPPLSIYFHKNLRQENILKLKRKK